MSKQVLSITQVNAYIRTMMDTDSFLSGVAVRGEISNYKRYPSGHHYFTLKDDNAALRCVLFRGNALHLKFQPENGMKIIAMGKISVYPRDGAYQLYCSSLIPDGIGDLHAAFEQLKKKLEAQGLFDPAHKKKLPRYPGTIGIVTSPAGAAVRDILRIIRERYPIARVVLLPVRVQGSEAPGEIVEAIRYANRHQLADLLIIGRGGGSIEDLWAFNEEPVAHAVFESEIPVISAVGHEPDITISDYVADLRAATPSNAAELAVPDQRGLRQTLDAMASAMATVVMRQLRTARQHLSTLSASPTLRSPIQYINQRRDSLRLMGTRLTADYQSIINQRRNQYIALTAMLDAMSPLKVLTRGYAMLQKPDGQVVRSVMQVCPYDRLDILVCDGVISTTINETKEKCS